MELAAVVQANIHVTSEKYRPVAARSSLIFFLMNDLVKLHTYYIYSLAAFKKVFYLGIDKVTEKKDEDDDAKAAEGDGEDGEEEEQGLSDEELAQRCIVLCDSITYTSFNYIRRGLFERDKLTVSTQLMLKILSK